MKSAYSAMAGKRRIWIIVAAVLAAIITPTVDLLNWAIVTIGLIAVYELSILLVRLFAKSQNK